MVSIKLTRRLNIIWKILIKIMKLTDYCDDVHSRRPINFSWQCDNENQKLPSRNFITPLYWPWCHKVCLICFKILGVVVAPLILASLSFWARDHVIVYFIKGLTTPKEDSYYLFGQSGPINQLTSKLSGKTNRWLDFQHGSDRWVCDTNWRFSYEWKLWLKFHLTGSSIHLQA